MDVSIEEEAKKDRARLTRVKARCYAIWATVGALLLGAVVVYLSQILSLPIGIIVWSAVIVFCLRGVVARLQRLGLSRLAGTSIAYVIMFVALGAIGFLVFSPAFGLGGQINDLIQSFPSYLDSISSWANQVYARYAHILQNDVARRWVNDALTAASDYTTQIARSSATNVVAIGTGTMNSLMVICFSMVVAFWILLDLPQLGREVRRLIGSKHEQDAEMLHVTLTRVMGGYIRGTIIQCTIIGIASGIWFAIVGVPNAAALGAITGVMNVIPIIGPWIGGLLAALIGIFVSPTCAVAALLGSVVIQQFVYTLISPRIMASSVDVHPALTFIALMTGSAVGGALSGLVGSLVGMLISIPAAAVGKAVFVYYFEKKTGRKLVSENGVFFKGTPKSEDSVNPIADATSPHPRSLSMRDDIPPFSGIAGRMRQVKKK